MEKTQFSHQGQWTPAICWSDSNTAISANLSTLVFCGQWKGIPIWSGVSTALYITLLKLQGWECNYYIFVSMVFRVLLLKLSLSSRPIKPQWSKGQRLSVVALPVKCSTRPWGPVGFQSVMWSRSFLECLHSLCTVFLSKCESSCFSFSYY